MSVNSTDRLPLSKYFATTVALITSHAEGVGENVMACEWTSNISYRPLRILSVINKNSYTHELISASREFGVNLCSDEQVGLSVFAGNAHGREVDKLSDPVFAGRIYQGKRIGARMLRGCLLNLECEVEKALDLDTHTGFVGRAVAGRTGGGARPLFYHLGRYFTLGEQLDKPGDTTPEPAVAAARGSQS